MQVEVWRWFEKHWAPIENFFPHSIPFSLPPSLRPWSNYAGEFLLDLVINSVPCEVFSSTLALLHRRHSEHWMAFETLPCWLIISGEASRVNMRLIRSETSTGRRARGHRAAQIRHQTAPPDRSAHEYKQGFLSPLPPVTSWTSVQPSLLTLSQASRICLFLPWRQLRRLTRASERVRSCNEMPSRVVHSSVFFFILSFSVL